MVNKVLFSSKSDEWETPQKLFDELSQEFNFGLDVCATKENAKCKHYFTKEDDGLKQDWCNEWGTVWCNPPYGRNIGEWIKLAVHFQAVEYSQESVFLLPARTDTKWFHTYIYQKEFVEVRFLPGRLKFGGSKNSAPFPSMVVVFS